MYDSRSYRPTDDFFSQNMKLWSFIFTFRFHRLSCIALMFIHSADSGVYVQAVWACIPGALHYCCVAFWDQTYSLVHTCTLYVCLVTRSFHCTFHKLVLCFLSPGHTVTYIDAAWIPGSLCSYVDCQMHTVTVNKLQYIYIGQSEGFAVPSFHIYACM